MIEESIAMGNPESCRSDDRRVLDAIEDDEVREVMRAFHKVPARPSCSAHMTETGSAAVEHSGPTPPPAVVHTSAQSVEPRSAE